MVPGAAVWYDVVRCSAQGTGSSHESLSPHSPAPLLRLSHLIRWAGSDVTACLLPLPLSPPLLCPGSKAGGAGAPARALPAPPPPRRTRHRAPGAPCGPPRRRPRPPLPGRPLPPAPRRFAASPLLSAADSASRVTQPRVPNLPPALSPPSSCQRPWGRNHLSKRALCPRPETALQGELPSGHGHRLAPPSTQLPCHSPPAATLQSP